ncbi:MAG: SDR family oxidoreductase [Actinomycetota bacterium]
MRIVVTGAGGAVARAFHAAAAHHDLVAFAHADLDVGDRAAVLATVPACDAIANLAAFTDVDGCEADPSRAARDNADAVGHLAEAARARGATLLQVSTDYVFDGTKATPYDEDDAPAPRSVYGRTKLAGEERARAVPAHVVARTGFLFGTGRDHLAAAVRALARGEEAGAIADRTGSPTYVPDLAAGLVALLEAGHPGTYHLAGPEPATWFAVLRRAAAIAGLPGRPVAQRAADLALRAPRPANSALASVRLADAGVHPLPPLDDALARFLAATLPGAPGSVA